MLKTVLSLVLMMGIMTGQQRKMIIKNKIDKDQKEITEEVNIVTENNEMTISINKDGEVVEYKVNLDDEKKLQKIKTELGEQGINIEELALHEENLFTIHSGGYLGVQIQNLSPQLRKYFKVKGDLGVLVSEVLDDSPAEKAGILAGDIITKVEKKDVSSSRDLTAAIRKQKPESKIQLTLIRNGREKSLKATLAAAENSFSWMGEMPGMKKHLKMKMKGGRKGDMHKKDVNFFKFSDDARDLHEEFSSNSVNFKQLQIEMNELREELKALREEMKNRP